MKKTMTTLAAFAMMATVLMTGCGENNDTATPDTATADSVTVETATLATLNETDQAIINSGLSVDKDGNIVNEKGEKVETTADGKVKVTTADGKEIEVDADKVTTAKTNNSNSNNSSNKSNSGSSNSSSKSNNSGSNSNSSSSSKSSSGSKSDSGKSSSSSSSKSDSSSSSSKTDEHAGKTYHEAIYKTIEHPAEYKTVTVIDREAYSYEEPIYEEVDYIICNVCGADITDNETSHMKAHIRAHEGSGSHVTTEYVQTGTKTVNVPAETHTEQQLVKEAWTEKILVKEAGWY